jgi:hypothetical protein
MKHGPLWDANIFLAGYEIPHILEIWRFITVYKQQKICHHFEPHKSNPCHSILCLRSILVLSSHLSTNLPWGLYLTDLSFKGVWISLLPRLCPVQPTFFDEIFIHTVPIYCPTWVKIGARDLHMMLSSSPGISWKLAKGRPCFSYGNKWKYFMYVPWQHKKCTHTDTLCVCVCSASQSAQFSTYFLYLSLKCVCPACFTLSKWSAVLYVMVSFLF